FTRPSAVTQDFPDVDERKFRTPSVKVLVLALTVQPEMVNSIAIGMRRSEQRARILMVPPRAFVT
ncbi:MAG: hypothetical protein VST65_08325, partial [Nitrospirota bacterium]|nr:hypothetical protein [Nitrospirota bacterium]